VLQSVFKSARTRLESEPAEESSESANEAEDDDEDQDSSMNKNKRMCKLFINFNK
jgi:hypothetical protein